MNIGLAAGIGCILLLSAAMPVIAAEITVLSGNGARAVE